MSNFFASGNPNNFNNSERDYSLPGTDKSKTSLDEQYNDLRNNYEQIFIEAAESIRRELDALKPANACKDCTNKDCKITKTDVFASFPPRGCKYRDWQMQALTFLAGDYRQKLKAEYKAIMDKKDKYECNKCGVCCKLAVSEYSYDQLQQRANKGDKFSEDFVSVFVPYENEEDAKKVNPEYFELLNLLVQDEKVFYYYCPKLEGNLCSIYNERPDICRNYPHNPLKLLPSECSFNEWRKEISHAAMLLKAKTDIIGYYKERLS